MNISKFATIPDGDFEVITLQEFWKMIQSGEVVNSPGNRESGKLKGISYANFVRRLIKSAEAYQELKDAAEAPVLPEQEEKKVEAERALARNMGLNDPIFVMVNNGQISIINGYHRTQTIAEFAPSFVFPRISEKKYEGDVAWYNDNIAGESIISLGKVGESLLNAPICLKKMPPDPIHLKGSNRNKSSNGAENIHYEYHDSLFAKSFIGNPLYYKNPDCPEFMAMYLFCKLARIGGSNTECVYTGFENYADSQEAVDLVKEVVPWFRRFKFLCFKHGKGHTNTLNLHKFKAICQVAYERVLENHFDEVEELVAKGSPAVIRPLEKGNVQDYLNNIETASETEIKLAFARLMVDELYAMTKALRLVDSQLDNIDRNKQNAADSADSGIKDWLDEPYSGVRAILKGVGL